MIRTGRWALAGGLWCAAGAAWGQEPPLPGGLLQLFPTAPIASGEPVDLLLVALNPDGTPATGRVFKATRTAGMATRWIEVGDGLYRMPYDPVPVADASLVTATAKGKLSTGEKVAMTATFQLLPPLEAPGVSVEPSGLMLGRDATAALTAVGAPAGMDLRVNLGAVDDLQPVPDGGWTGTYTPPNLNYPQQALIAWGTADDPLGERGHVVIPLTGSADYPVKAATGAKVSLQVGERTFGPITIGADGKGKVPVEVPPGAQIATQITVESGQERREPLDLKIPASRRLLLYPLPGSLPADPRVEVPLTVVVVTPEGQPDRAAKPVFTVSVGAVSETRDRGDGRYEALWHPAGSAGPAEVVVTLGDEVQTDRISVTLVDPRPTVVLSASATEIAPGAATVEVTAEVTDPTGAPLNGATVRFEPQGAEARGPVTALGGGAYQVTLVPGPTGPVEVSARLAPSASSEPVHEVWVVPGAPTVRDDGAASVDVLVATLDAQGVAVGEVPVTLEVLQGDGRLEATAVVTGHDGAAHTRYVAGTIPAVVGIRATAGAAAGLATLAQLPDGVKAPAVPGAPPPDVSRWSQTWPTLTLPRSTGNPTAAAVAAPVPAVPGPVGSIRLTANTDAAVAGASLTVTAIPLDAAGAAVASQPAEVVVTGGTAEPPVVSSDGTVTVRVVVPDPVTVPVVVTAKVGAVTQVLTIPPEASTPWAGAASAAPLPAPAPDPVATPEPPRTPAAPGEFPWFRGRMSGVASTYRYEQTPTADPGPLLPSRLTVGGPDGGAPAAPVGGEVDLRAWGDAVGVPYVGVHGQFRIASYGITATEFGDVARDVLTNSELDLLGRFPFSVAGDQYWAGAKLGVHSNDFMLFEGCLDAGCQIDTQPVNVVSLAPGVEIGADVGPLYLVAGYAFGLARGTQPYANAFDLNVGVQVAGPLTVDAGFGMLSRSIVLKGADSGLDRGDLSDAQTMFELGLGLAL